MNYTGVLAGRIVCQDGKVIELPKKAAEFLYLGTRENCFFNEKPRDALDLGVLGGRTLFERLRQKEIKDWLAANERPGLRRIMMVGDSIRMRISNATGYGLHAYARLLGKVNISHIPHNVGASGSVQTRIGNWLSCGPDLILINTGLHDLSQYDSERIRNPGWSSPDMYRERLSDIIARIRAANVTHVIWASNTPVVEAWHNDQRNNGGKSVLTRYNRDIENYNAIAADVMREEDVSILDFYRELVELGVERCILKDGVHLTSFGSKHLGKLAADTILTTLAST
jgi:lysophospholipase L1-like esterase